MMNPPETNEAWEQLISTVKSSLHPVQHVQYPAPDSSRIAKTIDHTQLSQSATEDQINTLCSEAREHQFATVCVRLAHVPRAVGNLKDDSSVGVACVVGFHQGTYSTAEKVAEAHDAVQQGASELDMVMNYPWLKEKRFTDVYQDIRAVREAAAAAAQEEEEEEEEENNVGLKVIFETSQLSRDEIIAASVVSCLAGADYLKTSTGFNGPGATVENVALMRAVAEAVKKGVKVKASGGVRTLEDCVNMVRAGADRIGASAGVKIVQDIAGGEAANQGIASSGGY